MSEITIVTAFFDIGRENWRNFERDKNKYINYFRFWARIQNKLVVYTDPITAEKVWEIREEYGLKDRTNVIVIDNIKLLDEEIFSKIQQVVSDNTFTNFRERPDNPESHSALYNYVTYLKPYFIADAVKRRHANGMIAWVDFGYNHGGEACTISSEFDFLWNYDFSDKIHIFATEEIDNMPIFDIVRKMRVYISGGIIIAPDFLWQKLADLFRKSVLHLSHCGLADADQTLLVMSYREAPKLFEVHPVMDWFMVLKEFGGKHLTLRTAKPLHKKYKKEAKQYWQKKQYKEAINWYFKYVKAKIVGDQRHGK
ncbi:WlaTC/HtrL family glycosyltransferase [Pelosinus sp. IPA-1]|uniref:WlaTC/HtrL family glycosyltransferase n=1 Tax=Pelosinus sp. IPA-1 TaxID=3029569 RepID=UPI0024361A02|nr:WlaTC/HtrL family glycosyltransferase [Pelosinus sp. IPA-1]GMB01268.1 protein HtrL [Pelosinus sp. IPA-1]